MLPGVQNILTFPAFLYFACVYRHALDIREHYERKLERANNLYMELSAIMLQLEVREKELMKYVKKLCFIVDMGRFLCCHTPFLPLSGLTLCQSSNSLVVFKGI